MEIDVVGGGAVGLLYAARLARGGHRIRVWTRTTEQAEALSRDGIRLTDLAGASANLAVQAGDLAGAPRRARISSGGDPAYGVRGGDAGGENHRALLLAVKQPAIGQALYEALERLAGPDVPVICLQNGIGHMDKLRAALPDVPFCAAVTTEGALREGTAAVRHTGAGRLWMEPAAALDAQSSDRAAGAQQLLLAAMNSEGIDASLSNDILIHVYRKLLVNAVINPLTALSGVRNGELPADPGRFALLSALCRETAAVLAAYGLADPDPVGTVAGVCRATAGNLSSMLADVKAGRPTEADWIGGGIVRLARAKGMEAPLNEAAVRLVKAMSGNGVESRPERER